MRKIYFSLVSFVLATDAYPNETPMFLSLPFELSRHSRAKHDIVLKNKAPSEAANAKMQDTEKHSGMLPLFFTKAVALGNDFVILDARKQFAHLTVKQIQTLANRRQGIGCDQLILILPPTVLQADIQLKFYNADGSEAGACGNGTRCAAHLVMENGDADKLCIQTKGALCHAAWADEKRTGIVLTLGRPQFAWCDIPLASPEALRDVAYEGITPFCVNVGNPHAVFFVDNVDAVPLAEVGPWVETHPAFPERANVGFAQVINADTIELRVWERGAGYTMACGTGACAAAVAAIHQSLVPSALPLRVIQEGGELLISWREGDAITMVGPARPSFRGEIAAPLI